MKTITKTVINKIADEIKEFLIKNRLAYDTAIYYNNIRESARGYEKVTWEKTENVNPLSCMPDANPNHILSMVFEGPLYNVLNYGDNPKMENAFDALIKKYGLYYEMMDAYNLTLYPIDEGMDIEFTYYQKEPETIHLYINKPNIPDKIDTIMNVWYKLSSAEGDKGSCVIGAGIKCTYNGERYFIEACSPHQGSISWETNLDLIKQLLRDVGCTNIVYCPGMMD